jgi:hypothetical protein
MGVTTSANELKKTVDVLIAQLDETNARLFPTTVPVGENSRDSRVVPAG